MHVQVAKFDHTHAQPTQLKSKRPFCEVLWAQLWRTRICARAPMQDKASAALMRYVAMALDCYTMRAMPCGTKGGGSP